MATTTKVREYGMNQESWIEAATAIEVDSKGHENRKAIALICKRVASSELSDVLSVDTSGLPNRIYITRTDGLYSNKRLSFESISEDRVEICFADLKARTCRCFFPSTPSVNAADRGMRIINNLDWNSDAKQHRNLWEWLVENTVGGTPDK